MASIDEIYVGTLSAATDLNKKAYADWRELYVGKQGLVCIFKSENIAKGKYFIKFYIVTDIKDIDDEADNLKTSPGDIYIDEEKGIIRIKTMNSIYSFSNVHALKE